MPGVSPHQQINISGAKKKQGRRNVEDHIDWDQHNIETNPNPQSIVTISSSKPPVPRSSTSRAKVHNIWPLIMSLMSVIFYLFYRQ